MKKSNCCIMAILGVGLLIGPPSTHAEDIVVGGVNAEIEEQIDEQVDEQVSDQVDESVDEQISDSVDEQIDDEVEDIVVGGVQNQIDEQVDDQIDEQINDTTDDQIDDQALAIIDEQVEDDIQDRVETDLESQVDESIDQQVDEEVAASVDEQVDDQIASTVESEVDSQVNSTVDAKVETNVATQVDQVVSAQIASSVEMDRHAVEVFRSDDVDKYVDAYREPKIPQAMLVLAPQEAMEQAESLGLELESRSVLGNLGMILGKISPYEAKRIARSAPELARQLERLDSDRNHLYRQYQLSSAPEDIGSTNIADSATARELVRDLGFRAPLRVSTSIGMIDSSVNTGHPCLKDENVQQKSLIPANKKPSTGHGTAVAAILAGSQNCETAGLLAGAQLFNASVFYDAGDGEQVADAASLLVGIDWLLGQNVSLINMSFAGPPNKLLERAIDVLAQRGVPVFAAVGNDGPLAPPRYPAAYPNTVAVTAVDREHAVYRLAGRGVHVKLAAPGVAVKVASDDGSGVLSGTSLAAPMAAAFYLGQLQHDADRAEVLRTLEVNAIDLGASGMDDTYGYGLVHLHIPTDATQLSAAFQQ